MIPTITRPFRLRCFVLVLISILSPAQAHAQEIPVDELARLVAEGLEETFSDLNETYPGELSRVYKSIGDYYAQTNRYHFGDKNEVPQKAFDELMVRILENPFDDGGMGAAMVAGVLFMMTPPETVLRSVAPHLGVGQRLDGGLNGSNNDLAEHLQRQSQQGHRGYPVFTAYVRYLNGSNRSGRNEYPNRDIIIIHMFETDPVVAFIAMLEVDYKLGPYGLSRAARGNDGRRLQLLNHQVHDLLYRTRYEFPVPDDLRSTVESDLNYAASHEKWWVRLYAAQIFLRHEELRVQDKIQALKEDVHPAVAEVAAKIK